MEKYNIPFRRKLQLATLAADVVGDFRTIWKFGRKYPKWLSKTYNRLTIIAKKHGINIPKPLIDMECEK